MEFKDHFSGHAQDYARYRPDYPAALYHFLANTAKRRELAWDCGTGSGQAALGLAAHFDRVIATDPSAEQIQNAARHEKINYLVAAAEQTEIPSQSVDLITAAQAAHWFDMPRFSQEARRVLKPDGLLALWCYGLTRINPVIDRIVAHYYKNVVGPYWPPERRYIDEKYQTLAFPFTELSTPSIHMQAEWDLSEFTGYLATWSAAQRFQKEHRRNPLDSVRGFLATGWGAPQARRTVRWLLHLRIGRVAPG